MPAAISDRAYGYCVLFIRQRIILFKCYGQRLKCLCSRLGSSTVPLGIILPYRFRNPGLVTRYARIGKQQNNKCVIDRAPSLSICRELMSVHQPKLHPDFLCETRRYRIKNAIKKKKLYCICNNIFEINFTTIAGIRRSMFDIKKTSR